MGELVPHEFSAFPGGMLQGRLRRPQVSSNHSIPVSEAGIDMGRHMERVGIARRDRLVLARDLQRFPFAPRHVVGVDEIVHGARMVRIPLVHAEEDFGGPVGMRSGNRIGGGGGQMRQGVERRRLGVVRQGRHKPFPWPVPTGGCGANSPTMPVRGRTPPPQPRRAVPAPSAAEGTWPSALPPIPAGALRVAAASARAAETASSRCPSAPSRTGDRSPRLAETPPVPVDTSCDAGGRPLD